jgi:hypothetical protein
MDCTRFKERVSSSDVLKKGARTRSGQRAGQQAKDKDDQAPIRVMGFLTFTSCGVRILRTHSTHACTSAGRFLFASWLRTWSAQSHTVETVCCYVVLSSTGRARQDTSAHSEKTKPEKRTEILRTSITIVSTEFCRVLLMPRRAHIRSIWINCTDTCLYV